jgi:hypothetical protein
MGRQVWGVVLVIWMVRHQSHFRFLDDMCIGLTGDRCISNTKRFGRGVGEQYASWGRNGKSNELHQPGSSKQVFMSECQYNLRFLLVCFVY